MNHRFEQNCFFVYQAYGKVEILQQTLFSIVSLWFFVKGSANCKIVIFTDQKEYFTDVLGEPPQIEYEMLTPEKITAWKGKIQFVHRLKIEMLADVVQKRSGRFIYLDGDTYFLSDPRPLIQKMDERNTLMHLPEGKISELKDPLSKKLRKFLKREMFELNGQPYQISPDLIMWNAGVIGYSEAHAPLLKQILELTDQTYGKYQKHVMEQMSVSDVLQKNTSVHRTDNVIYHYWNQKDEYQKRIGDFLGEGRKLNQLVENYQQFSFPEPPRPKPNLLKKLKMWLDSH